MRTRRKDIIIAASIGIGLGLVLLAGIALLARPYYTAAIPTAQSVPTLADTSLPSATPIVAPSATPEPTSTPTLTPEPSIYVVQEGDSLSDIALEYNTTVEAIKAANGLTSDIIYTGDELTIPPSTVILPTPTPFIEGEAVIHTVVSGDTLSDIAEQYGVTTGAIMSANGLTSDAIQAGQKLIIPIGETITEVPTAEPSTQAWQPSILEGDLEAAYPLTVEPDRFTLHYQPNSLPAQDRDIIVGMVETALNHIESTLQVDLEGRFDAYVAGSLFAPPNLALRGRSFSSQRRFFFLYDGTGTAADRQYILTHELTHLTTWNTMGRPTSVMLHEGVAVYVGMELVEDGDYIPIDGFCAAYHQTGRLPSVSGSPSFQGHIRDLDTYYAAGCFVQYLIEEYGADRFAEVYHTGDYYSVYGQGLTGLEAEWTAAIESSDYSLSFDLDELAYYVTEVGAAYDRLFVNFTGTAAQMNAYQELDQARMTVLQGHFGDAEAHLATFDQLLGNATME